METMTLSPHSTGNTFATLSPHSTANTEATLSPTSGSRRPQRRGGGSRLGSRFRGVTHHSRTARYESHLWDNGKQVYLGGFNIEAAAALAYDLAGVSYRGTDALLNGRWSLVEKELQCRHTITREDVIQKLRTQSKHMNKINTNGPVMTRTDLLISKCMNPNQEHIGLYCTADDAARAYDRALIERLGGVLASSFLNFPLYEYGDMLSEEERQVAVALNVVPDDAGIEPTCPPVPIFDLNAAGPGDEVPFEDATSVLDMLANAAETEGDEVGVKRESTMEAKERGTVRRSKRSRKVVASLCEDDPTGDDL